MGNFKQLSLCERTIIETYLNDGKTATFIAEKRRLISLRLLEKLEKIE